MFSLLRARNDKKELELLDREYHMTKLYVGMVKAASEFMKDEDRKRWLELNDPEKMDGCISLFYGGVEWFDLENK